MPLSIPLIVSPSWLKLDDVCNGCLNKIKPIGNFQGEEHGNKLTFWSTSHWQVDKKKCRENYTNKTQKNR
jgi:hypothetical protein